MRSPPEQQNRRTPAWMMDFEEFIGPSVVSEVFAFDPTGGDYDLLWDLEDNGLDDLRIVSHLDPDLLVRDLEWDNGANYVLVERAEAGERIVGCYLAGMLWIDPEFRGRGLGSDLIAISAEDCGTSPVSNDGGLGFTEGGFRAHERAHKKIIRRALLRGEDVPSHLRQLVDGPDGAAAPSP